MNIDRTDPFAPAVKDRDAPLADGPLRPFPFRDPGGNLVEVSNRA